MPVLLDRQRVGSVEIERLAERGGSRRELGGEAVRDPRGKILVNVAQLGQGAGADVLKAHFGQLEHQRRGDVRLLVFRL